MGLLRDTFVLRWDIDESFRGRILSENECCPKIMRRMAMTEKDDKHHISEKMGAPK